MKKLMLLLLVMGCGVSFSWAQSSSSITRHVIHALSQHRQEVTPNKGAINQPQEMNFLTVYHASSVDISQWADIHYPRQNDCNCGYVLYTHCKAYALDSHWLIASANCINPDRKAYKRFQENERYDDVRIETSLANRHFNFVSNERVTLIYVKPEYEQTEKGFSAPFANVLAFDNPQAVHFLNANNTFAFHTDHVLGISSVRHRALQLGSVHNNTLNLRNKLTDLSAEALDPLFLITPQENEFLLGFNQGNVNSARGTYEDSNSFYTLTAEDLRFIRQMVNKYRPQDWPHISQRLFLNTTDKPCIK
ncbi:MAG: hypothetical protein IKO35_07005 [Elusimicrobiaceae bacterium]|nr:hypothetical protein [Elusimicrobiaceae bacterium]